jgi:hypothetical protein
VIGLLGFILFLWLILFLLSAIRVDRPDVALIPRSVEATATSSFTLPPTWTPTPFQEVVPSPTGTDVALGLVPTRIYTPRPTSLPGLPTPRWWAYYGIMQLTVLDLARIMQGESPGDKEAAYMVGWVAKNRLLHQGYGDTYFIVSSGFFGYRPDLQPNDEFLDIARRVIHSNEDPTDGCLYALSRTDITNLGVPPGRADVAYGEWFFFRTWPLSGR